MRSISAFMLSFDRDCVQRVAAGWVREAHREIIQETAPVFLVSPAPGLFMPRLSQNSMTGSTENV